MSENNMYPGVEAQEETKQSLTELATDLNQASVIVQPETVPQETETKTEVKPEEEKKLIASEIERFDIKKESKVLKALSNIFPEQDHLVNEEDLIQAEQIGVVDPAHVCMCIGLTIKGKLALRRFFSSDCNPKIPHLCFDKQQGNSMFATDYFFNILKVINEVSDNFRIIEGTDNPCIIETEDFRFLLAPRIEEE